jgi:toxin CcdB
MAAGEVSAVLSKGMAQFDVHRLGTGLVVDCQSELLGHIDSRFVVPLAPSEFAAIAAQRLNPRFEIAGDGYIMVTQQAASVPRSELGPVIASLADQSFEITGAIDVLLSGV